MNTKPGLVGKKLGMMQFFTPSGEVVRCTAVKFGGVVVGKRTQEKDGYDALIMGLGERKEKHATKADSAAFKKAGVTPKKILRELRGDSAWVAKFEVGQKIKVDDVFSEGQFVDAQGTTIGRGFTGVVKRWGFAGGVQTHGTHEYRRHGGSIGTNMTPGRTLPGKKMCGQYGNETTSTLNLKVAKLLVEDDIVLIAGAVPGPKDGTVLVRAAVKKKLK